jgi:two-component system chemotaxis response regulator CheY
MDGSLIASLRLLVIDDHAQMRTIVGTVLTAAGVRHLHYAQDGRQGLRVLADFHPDVCYVDYEMPVMNGLDFVSAVRSLTTADRYLPIIMLTAHSDLTRLAAARDRGVTEFLCKPVTAKAILSRLQAVILQARPFVEISDYFGPNRRRRSLPNYAGPLRRSSDHPSTLDV